MKVWGATEAQLRAAAKAAGVAMDLEPVPLRRGGPCFKVKLRPVGDRYRRVGFRERKDGELSRIAATCFHGFLHFLNVVYAKAPAARVRSGMAAFNGAEDYKAKRGAIASRNVGSLARPHAYGSLCVCGERERARAAAAGVGA